MNSCDKRDRVPESIGPAEFSVPRGSVTATSRHRDLYLFSSLPLQKATGLYLFSKSPKALTPLRFFFSVSDVTLFLTPILLPVRPPKALCSLIPLTWGDYTIRTKPAPPAKAAGRPFSIQLPQRKTQTLSEASRAPVRLCRSALFGRVPCPAYNYDHHQEVHIETKQKYAHDHTAHAG